MALCPSRLLNGMRVKFFGSLRTSSGIGKYLMPNPQFGFDAIANIFMTDCSSHFEELTHVSKTQFGVSQLHLVMRLLGCLDEESTMKSKEQLEEKDVGKKVTERNWNGLVTRKVKDKAR